MFNFIQLSSFLLLFFLGSCASVIGDKKYSVIENQFYTKEKTERQKGVIYKPTRPNSPGIVLVHGGGWRGRSLEDMETIAESLASHGFAVYNINYRFAPEHKHPTPIEDLKTALKYLKKNHQKYNVNPQNIALWGYSSGGHTVSYFATQYPQEIKAVVAGGAPYDFSWYPKSPYIFDYIGKYRDDALAEYEKASPAYHVKKGLPPFFIYHAVSDKLVEFAQATAFEAKLLKHKNFVERFDISFWGHTYAFIFSKKTTEKAITFLKKFQHSKHNDLIKNPKAASL
jgi:acetyl esterase/lipase